MENLRAEILVNGLVQGVGFRYFVLRLAQKLGVNGYTQNLFTGEVLTVVEAPKLVIEDLFQKIKVGPTYANVKNATIKWGPTKNEFTKFEIRQ